MKVDKVIATIEELADPTYSASWDFSGVQVASKNEDIFKLAVCLDPLPSILKQAAGWGADFVLSHHPVTLSPRLPSTIDLYHEVLSVCFKENLWLYAAHTSLDVQLNGPVSWLAKELSLESIEPIEPVESERSIGFGVIGRLSVALKKEEFFYRLRSLLGIDRWLEVGKPPESIEVIAYCPGSGMSLAERAFSKGAHVFISGEVKHHLALELERLGFVVDVGHFVLEERMMEVWSEELKNIFSRVGVKVKFFKQEKPIRYTR